MTIGNRKSNPESYPTNNPKEDGQVVLRRVADDGQKAGYTHKWVKYVYVKKD